MGPASVSVRLRQDLTPTVPGVAERIAGVFVRLRGESVMEPIQDDRPTIKTWTWPLIQFHHEEPFGPWADSPDVPGWSATGDDMEELGRLIDDAKEVVFRPMGWPHG
jgi:hypothetical protein